MNTQSIYYLSHTCAIELYNYHHEYLPYIDIYVQTMYNKTLTSQTIDRFLEITQISLK